jgi:hypothetical protein
LISHSFYLSRAQTWLESFNGFFGLLASREPMMILTPGAPRRSANAPPRFPVPPTIATVNGFSIRLLEMAKEIFRLGAEKLPHRSILLVDLTAPNNNNGTPSRFPMTNSAAAAISSATAATAA